MDISIIAVQIKNYAASTTDHTLDDLATSLSTLQAAGAVLNDIIASDVVQTCVLKLVSAVCSGPHKLDGWYCLSFLASQKRYSGAKGMITVFAESSPCLLLLTHLDCLFPTATTTQSWSTALHS
jgi:hypothetical protein